MMATSLNFAKTSTIFTRGTTEVKLEARNELRDAPVAQVFNQLGRRTYGHVKRLCNLQATPTPTPTPTPMPTPKPTPTHANADADANANANADADADASGTVGAVNSGDAHTVM